MKLSVDVIKKGIEGAYFYLYSHVLLRGKYDQKYLTGRWFQGKADGLCSTGWKWAVNDYRGCRRLNVNRDVPWPVSPRTTVMHPKNIFFHPDDLNNFQGFGCYFQGNGKIVIGHGTYIGPNVGIITANHNVCELDRHEQPKSVIIGEKCWIGMNVVILPGVVLGNETIVGAGSVVTKPFPEGHCTLAGNPARVIG